MQEVFAANGQLHLLTALEGFAQQLDNILDVARLPLRVEVDAFSGVRVKRLQQLSLKVSPVSQGLLAFSLHLPVAQLQPNRVALVVSRVKLRF